MVCSLEFPLINQVFCFVKGPKVDLARIDKRGEKSRSSAREEASDDMRVSEGAHHSS